MKTAQNLWLGLALFLLIQPGLAFAQSAEAPGAADSRTGRSPLDLEALKETGDAAYRERRFADALAAYDQAYAIAPEPRITFNRSRALAALARYPEALTALEQFERDAPADLKARVPQLPDLLAELRGRVAILTIRAVPGARVLVGGSLVGIAPLSAARLNAGKTTLEVLADGYLPYSRNVELPANRETALDVNLVAKELAAKLKVASKVAGSTATVDGIKRGNTPLELLLVPGSHHVVVRHADYEPAERIEVLRAGDVKSIDLDPKPRVPITAKWWFWTGVGVVVAGAVVTTIALTTERAADHGDIAPGQLQAPLAGF